MTYDVIVLACEQLSYRDKFRLAQLLIQTARKEEENASPQKRPEINKEKNKPKDISEKPPETEKEIIDYVVERLLKLKPVKKKSLSNSIKSMFQFQGGISDSEIETIISKLQKKKYLKIEQNNVSYY